MDNSMASMSPPKNIFGAIFYYEGKMFERITTVGTFCQYGSAKFLS